MTEHEVEVFKQFCWRITDLARSRKTGAIQELCNDLVGPPPAVREPWIPENRYLVKNILTVTNDDY